MSRLTDVFLDTAYAIALTSRDDKQYVTALALSFKLEIDQVKIVTTEAILIEIGNSFSKLQKRANAVSLIDSLINDPIVEIVPVSTKIFRQPLNCIRRGNIRNGVSQTVYPSS